jgi:DNA-binding transcriptional LysR family regulator
MSQQLPRLPHRYQLRVQQLNMILRLIEHGSISAAAADLKLSQSAVTKALQEVESTLGVMLFHRDARGLRPTSYCEVVERFARDVVIGLDEVASTLQGMLAGEHASVRLGASTGEPQRLLASATGRLRAAHPRVHVTLQEGNGPALLRWLDAGRIDFALMTIPPQLQPERYARLVLGHERALALVRPEHPLRETHDGAKALLESGWVLPPLHDPLRDWLAATWQGHEIDSPADTIEADAASALDLAAAMDLVCVVSESQAAPHLARGALVPLALPFELPTLPYGLVRWRRRRLRVGAALTLRAVKEALRQRRQDEPGSAD